MYYALVDFEAKNVGNNIHTEIIKYLENICKTNIKFKWVRIRDISTTWEVICNIDDKAIAKNHIIFELNFIAKLFKINLEYAFQLCTDPVIKS